jgi:hypothetical protein
MVSLVLPVGSQRNTETIDTGRIGSCHCIVVLSIAIAVDGECGIRSGNAIHREAAVACEQDTAGLLNQVGRNVGGETEAVTILDENRSGIGGCRAGN